MHVVAADTSPRMRQLYRGALARLGHTVRAVASGRQLVHQCELLQPDLVISEVHLHDMDFFQAGSTICQSRRVPIIIVSANCETELLSPLDDDDCVFAILAKPVREEELRAVIDWAVERFEEPHLLTLLGQ